MEDENELIALSEKNLKRCARKASSRSAPALMLADSIAEVREQFKEGETRRVAGRITAHRDMGKSHFLDLRDVTGRIQIYIHAKEIGPELFDLFRLLDIGDFIGVEGTCFVTKSGEPTVKSPNIPVARQDVAAAPGKMAWTAGYRSALQAALS
jgi:Lysyl-tRNA synthetase (class II)